MQENTCQNVIIRIGISTCRNKNANSHVRSNTSHNRRSRTSWLQLSSKIAYTIEGHVHGKQIDGETAKIELGLNKSMYTNNIQT